MTNQVLGDSPGLLGSKKTVITEDLVEGIRFVPAGSVPAGLDEFLKDL